MEWTPQQRAALAHEYERVRFGAGELIPFPDPPATPDEYLALLRSIPDGAGLSGYLTALARRARDS